MNENKTQMVPVPIPTEVPPPPELKNIPLDILHSATVEMLIQQNEDLSSRLKVNIRRNSQLEQRILSQEKEITELNRKRENVLAQIAIIKEKEKIWTEKKQEQERKTEALHKEIDLLEVRYNELSATAKQKQKIQQGELLIKQQKIVELESKLDILHRVRARAKERLRQFLLEMAQGLQKNDKSIRKSESSNRLLKQNFSQLKNDIIEKENFFREQLQNLKAASEQSLRNLDQKITDLQVSNESLQRQKDEASQEIQELKQSLHEERKNRIRLKKALEDLNELKNERIRLKRQLADQEESAQDTFDQQKDSLQRLRTEVSDLESQVSAGREKLSLSEKKILQLAKDNKELSQQLATIQKLWIESQENLEKAELRSETLEKINRQLSQKSQTEETEKSIQAAHPDAQTIERPVAEEVFQKRIQNVYASQYRTLADPPDMDL
jgi:chromosome segregation ATPase